ncbi:MAG: hypothetical protein ACT4OO_08635 [Nitrospiraceae bacterium]
MASLLTPEHIESAIRALPSQGRIMLRLLLLQYLDVPQEDIEYIVGDQPDPRRQTGSTAPIQKLTGDAIRAVADREAQYRRQVRLRRERTWLQTDCLRKLSDLSAALARQAERLLVTKFELAAGSIEELRKQARSALPKPALRALDQRWERDEIPEQDYQKERLTIEYQTQLRVEERHRKRLDLSIKEHSSANTSPLQDHEIGHIWGIPAGSLAARKLKYLNQYVQTLQTELATSVNPATQPPLDLWKETLAVLSRRPIERSVSTYDGLERTEPALIEKLQAFAWGTLPEEIEGRFWLSLVQGASSNAVHAEPIRSLFGLQRLAAILADLDRSPESLEEALLTRVTPRSKAAPAALLEEKKSEAEQLGEMGEHVLKSFFGEEHTDLTGRR